jgi:ABC-type Zn uptake system ZnuABC Zn-binding protein ZnuA
MKLGGVDRRVVAALGAFVLAAGAAGCSSDAKHVGEAGATSVTVGDGANASSAGDPATAAAIRRVANFRCPPDASAAGKATSRPPAGRRLQVVTTVAPITSIVANVAGDRADVRGIIPEGQDSHTYEPKPSVAALIATANVVFLNGLSLENPTKDLATENVPAEGQIVELGSIVLKPDEYIYDFSFPRDGGKPNPHLWTNPPMARCYAVVAASVLSRADPSNADYYLGNARKFAAKIDDLNARLRTASDSVPGGHRELLTYHDAYAYFAAQYGWKVIGAIQVSNFEDPTPKEVARLIKQIKSEGVPAIFGSEVFPSQVLAQIGKEAGVKYVDKLRDDDLPGVPGDADHSYVGLMKADFITMVNSLGGDAGSLDGFDTGNVTKDLADYPQ